MGVLYLRTCLSRRVAFDVYERRDDNMAEGWTSFVGVTNRDLDLTSSVTIYSCHCKLTLNYITNTLLECSNQSEPNSKLP